MKKKIILSLIILQIIIIILRKNKYNFENKLIRYIKYNRKQIPVPNKDDKLLSILNYIKSLKEKNHTNFKYRDIMEPKVSFISPVFNQLNYLSTFILSIQNQKLKDYELIFIDDFSMDQSVQFIIKQKKDDKRIKIIKNKKNYGALYSRYIGQKIAQSKYSIFVDCDDIVLFDGIFNSFNHIIKYDLDIVQFHTVWQYQNEIKLQTYFYKYNNIIYQPILSYIFFYDDHNYHQGNELNFALWDKLIKTDIINKAFQFIGDKYVKQNIFINNDSTILFAIFQVANSYHYINEIGYFYFRNNINSTQNSWNNPKLKEIVINGLLLNLQFFYEKTKDTYLDKYYSIFKIEQYFKKFIKLFNNLNNEQNNYIINIIDKLLNLNYISNTEKLKIFKIKILILNKKEAE